MTPHAYPQGLQGRKAQAAPPHGQNVATRVELSIDDQPTADAPILSVRQREIRSPVATARALRRCIRGVHGNGAPVSPSCPILPDRRSPPATWLHAAS